MNVLITGGAGFIGSHLAEATLDRGDSVIVVDDLSTGSLDNIAHLQSRRGSFQFIRESVCNESAMADPVSRCDVIFHLAAAVGVRLIADDPVRTIETNIHGSQVVMKLANRFARKVVVASSSEAYGKNTKTPFHEDDDTTLGSTRFSRWSYACSKIAEEFLALAYHDEFGLPVVICRLFNTIGPRQTGQYGMVVPRFIRWALANQPIQIYGTGRQSRCFTHVADVVDALVRLVDCDQAVGEVVNIGSGESVTIEALADMIIRMTGSTGGKRYVSYEAAYGRPMDDMLVRVPDLSKIKKLVGFQPKYTLAQTLQEIIDYEKSRIEADKDV
ncbi:MAG TPA: GDP-mannose 4,6-dehydratase [Phycisphaerae bacterium]|nr:GDP-mannose 4,6-dehydratase [Phycisphaerae bacterium]